MREIASLLQQWWYFGLVSEVLQADVKHEDFIVLHSSGRLSVTTARLGEYLQAWESRLAELDPQKALLELRNSKRCVDYAQRQIETLGRFIEDQISTKPAEDTFSPSALDTIVRQKDELHTRNSVSLVTSVLLEAEWRFWVKYGRIGLPENLELGICILGHTLSHAIHRIQARLGLENDGTFRDQAWYTPAFIQRRLIRSEICP
ncbi:hypothetical protein DV736_g2733, partial [Chaetothyriales sp. CBS 134916]